MDNGCGFFGWYYSPMCARSKKMILGLLRRIYELELRVEYEMLEDGNFSESAVSSTRLGNRGKMKETVCWFFLVCVLDGFWGRLCESLVLRVLNTTHFGM